MDPDLHLRENLSKPQEIFGDTQMDPLPQTERVDPERNAAVKPCVIRKDSSPEDDRMGQFGIIDS